jgi:hypothetical protein
VLQMLIADFDNASSSILRAGDFENRQIIPRFAPQSSINPPAMLEKLPKFDSSGSRKESPQRELLKVYERRLKCKAMKH